MLHLSPRPLTSSDADSGLFVDREQELRRLTRCTELGLNTLLVGPAGSGKTSLLHQVKRQLRDGAAYVGAAPALTTTDVARRVARATSGVASAADDEVWPPRDALARHRLRSIGAGRSPSVVLLDGLAPDLVHEMFGRHRDDVWEAPQTAWIVSTHTAALGPPEDAFFSAVVHLGPLDDAAIADLLRRRAQRGGKSQDAADLTRLAEHLARVLRAAWPGAVLAAAASVLVAERPEDALARLEQHELASERLSTTHRRVLEALLELGPVHAGDERLLTQLGVTRTRAVQVLQELQLERLVVPVRQGRRVLYDLAWRAA